MGDDIAEYSHLKIHDVIIVYLWFLKDIQTSPKFNNPTITESEYK